MELKDPTPEKTSVEYSSMPLELREKIWFEFCPEINVTASNQAHIFQVLISRCSTHFQCSTPHGAHVSAGLFLRNQTQNLRIVLAVHSETRAMAEKAFPDSFEIDANNLAENQGVVRFNRNRDIVLIHQKDKVHLDLRRSATWAQLGQAIVKVGLGFAVTRAVNDADHLWEKHMLSAIHQDFRGLNTLYVAISGREAKERQRRLARMFQKWRKHTQRWELQVVDIGEPDRCIRYWWSRNHKHEYDEESDSDEETDFDEEAGDEDRIDEAIEGPIQDVYIGTDFQFRQVARMLEPKLRLMVYEGYEVEKETTQLERQHGTRSSHQKLQRIGLLHLLPEDNKLGSLPLQDTPLKEAAGSHVAER